MFEGSAEKSIFSTDKIKDYPFLISYTLTEMEKARSENDVRGEFEFLIASYIQIVRFLGCIVVADYLEKGEACQENKLNRVLDQLRRPTLGTWKETVSLSFLTYKKNNWDFYIKDLNQLAEKIKSMKYEGCQYESFETTSTKSLGVLEALLELRKIVAHGGSVPDLNLCKSLIDFYRPILIDLVDALYFLKDYKLFRVINAEAGEVLYLHGVHTEGVELVFPIDTIVDDEILLELEDDEICMLTKHKEKPVLKLFPIFLHIDDPNVLGVREQPNGFLEPVFTFEGYESKRIAYLGVKVKIRRNNEYLELTSRFGQKGLDLKINKEHLYPWTLQAVAKDSSEEEIGRLLNVKYFPGFYTPRKNIEKSLDQFIDSMYSGFILCGESGVGKSSLLCHKTQQWIGSDKVDRDIEVFENINYHIVLYINSASLVISNKIAYPVLEKVKSALNLDPAINSIEELLYYIEKHRKDDMYSDRKVIIILDAINESPDTFMILQELNDWIVKGRQEKYSWLKIIFSIRTTTFEVIKHKLINNGAINPIHLNNLYFFPNPDKRDEITGESEVEWELTRFTKKEFQDAFERRKQSKAPCPNAEFEDIEDYYHTLSHPLLLDMLCKVFDNRLLPKNITETSLFQKYHLHTFSKNNDLEIALNKVVEIFYLNSRSFIYYSEIFPFIEKWECSKIGATGIVYLNPYEKLLDEGIIYEGIEYNETQTEKNILIRFTHQRYFEFLLTRFLDKLLKTPISIHEVNEQLKKFKDFPELFEVTKIIICRELIKDNYSLWNRLLLQTGKEEFTVSLLSEAIVHLVYEDRGTLEHVIRETLKIEINEDLHSMLMLSFEKIWNNGNGYLAVNYLEQLIERLTEGTDLWVISTISLSQKLSITAGRFYDAIGLLEKVELASSKDNKIMTEVYRIRGKVYSMLCHWDKAFESFRKLEHLTVNDPVTQVTALVNNQLCHNLYRANAEIMEKALDITKGNKELFPYNGLMHEGRILGNIGSVYIHQGLFKEGEEYLLKARQTFNELGHNLDLLLVLNNIGFAQIRNKQYATAKETYTYSIKLAEQFDDGWGKLCLEFNLAAIMLVEGNREAAREMFLELQAKFSSYSEHPSKQAELAVLMCNLLLPNRDITIIKSELLKLRSYFISLGVQYPELFIIQLLEIYCEFKLNSTSIDYKKMLIEAEEYLVMSEELFNYKCLSTFYKFLGIETTQEKEEIDTPFVEIENGLNIPLYLKIRFWEI